MKKIFILAIALLIVGNLGNLWAIDITLKAGKITNLPYKSDLVGGVSFDFSLAPSVKFLKNLRGEVSFLLCNPEWQLWQDTVWAKSNQILSDMGLSYRFSEIKIKMKKINLLFFELEKIRLQPNISAGFGYLMASLDWQDNSYNYSYYDDYYQRRYTLESKNSFTFYLGTGLKVFVSKNTFIKSEIKIFQAGDRKITAFLVGIGFNTKLSKNKR